MAQSLSMRHLPLAVALALSCTLPLPAWQAAAPAAPASPIAQGDAAWARRGQGQQAGKPQPGPVGEAIAAYERALKAEPGNLEASWKLLCALHFQGDYLARSSEEKQKIFARGRDVAEAAIDRIGQRAGGRKRLDGLPPRDAAKAIAGIPEARPIHLWAAVHWGLWGDSFGRLAAARQGVGDRVRRSAEILLALDETYEEAAGHRILGRLHTLAPKVPLVTGWVDRGLAVSSLRRAVALAPDNFLNHVYLAEALLEHQPDRKAEARQILQRLIARRPAPERVVEDERALADARALLAKSGQ
jgi:tetratricopeptide (TPR) repeat protein